MISADFQWLHKLSPHSQYLNQCLAAINKISHTLYTPGGESPQWLLFIFESNFIICIHPHRRVAAKFIHSFHALSSISSKQQHTIKLDSMLNSFCIGFSADTAACPKLYCFGRSNENLIQWYGASDFLWDLFSQCSEFIAHSLTKAPKSVTVMGTFL